MPQTPIRNWRTQSETAMYLPGQPSSNSGRDLSAGSTRLSSSCTCKSTGSLATAANELLPAPQQQRYSRKIGGETTDRPSETLYGQASANAQQQRGAPFWQDHQGAQLLAPGPQTTVP